jgi:hypothetical protein
MNKNISNHSMIACCVSVVCLSGAIHAAPVFDEYSSNTNFRRAGRVVPINAGNGFQYSIKSLESYRSGRLPGEEPTANPYPTREDDPAKWSYPVPTTRHWYSGGVVPRSGDVGVWKKLGVTYQPPPNDSSRKDLGDAITQKREALATVKLWARCEQGPYSSFEIAPEAKVVFEIYQENQVGSQKMEIEATAQTSDAVMSIGFTWKDVSVGLEVPVRGEPGLAWFSLDEDQLPIIGREQYDHAPGVPMEHERTVKIIARAFAERPDPTVAVTTSAIAKWGYYSNSGTKQLKLQRAFNFQRKR